ncbi:lasso peptide isopeptide bond-forming cyclase [Streptomyces sp. ISL-36]|uniref:lasso peptide isopeptide bond-forming cyclase n=1 Tax=Streptomyces sp. ISL-36 TaxID=2819182 RepID=UPI001BE6D695|nr:lasso peptide isopeptide bond-forming cyclase [Streptomyces sp. ISL-36]MBT2445221.1 lasso peptide isopeptide bond-forming cyclase [Streptomyces sp. ISL-36]
MVGFPAPDEVPGWFVALPDSPVADRVGATLRDRAAVHTSQALQEVGHPSGRPWLLGRWSPGTMAVGEAGRVKIAVVGEHAVTADRLVREAGRLKTVADLDGPAGSLVGSAHLAASVAGCVRLQGSVTGLRRVFHARIGDATVAADRADVLADLLDAEVDEQRLAVRLLNSFSLYPLAGDPVWREVSAVPTGHCLVLEGDGRGGSRGRTVPWWSPPEPVVPMAEGAPALREALSAAVDARVHGRSLVSCDLGGLDSTSVCSLAARGSAELVAYTADGRDPMGDDVPWARRTVERLSGIEHHVIAGDRLPMVYEGLADVDARFDEPCPAAAFLSRWLAIPRLAAARGSPLHLTGFGGDELLAGSPAHLHALMRTHPRLALQRVRGFAAQRPWPYRETLRQLWDSSPYRVWLARAGDELTAAPPPQERPTLDWGAPPRLPPWATEDAVEAVRGLIRTAARTTEPLAQSRGQHVELAGMAAISRTVRQLGEVAGRFGLALSAPYYDDRVIEAGLAVRPLDRITPWRYKPLIVEAMRGIVPDESLTRDTKDEGSHEVEVGLREHRAGLLALCEDSRLGRLGLIDVDAFREVCSRPLPPTLPFDALYQTAACEMWLRTREIATVPG